MSKVKQIRSVSHRNTPTGVAKYSPLSIAVRRRAAAYVA